MFKSALEGIGNGIVNLYEFVKSLPSGVWNLFQITLENITNKIISIDNFFDSFFVNCLEFLKSVFVPSDNYFIEKFEILNSEMEGKLNVDTSILEQLSNGTSTYSVGDEIGKFSFEIMGIPCNIDFSFITQIRNITLSLGNAMVLIFLCWYHIRKIIWVIRGSEPVGGSGGYGGDFISNAPQLTNGNSHMLR